MQGTQSNSTPQQRPEQRPDQWREQRDLTAPRNGPLEAAKQSAEVRTDYPGLPVRPSPETDGRPGWLRRWAGEPRRDADVQAAREGQNTSRGPSHPTEDAALAPHQDSANSAGFEAVAGPSNGHTGHSIEAAFDFETVFHFETDLEAESTDDWLDLSDEGPHSTANEDNTWEIETRESTAAAHKDNPAEFGHGLEHLPDSEGLLNSPREDDRAARSPDPKAVRAAIFRLAQQSHGAQISKLPSAETSDSGVEGPTSMTPEGGFAEVARRVWGAAGTDAQTLPESAPAEGYGPIGELSSSARTGWKHASDEPHGDRRTAQRMDARAEVQAAEGNQAGGVASETMHPAGLDGAGGTLLERHTSTIQPDKAQNAGAALGGRDAAPPVDGRGTMKSGLSNPASASPHDSDVIATGQDESARLGSCPDKPVQSGQSDAVAAAHAVHLTGGETEAQVQNATPQEALPELGEAQGRASGGPALAHDAGNLLSALKLYSELLALSGVLQARHKHYAEDLKLLASRSEALIDRLLASCNLAEREAQRLLQESANRNVADAVVTSSGLPSTNSGNGQQPVSTTQLASEPLLPVTQGTGIKGGTVMETEAGDHLNAGFAEAAVQTQASGQSGEAATASADGLHGRDEQGFASIGARSAPGLTNNEVGEPVKSEENEPGPVNLVDLLTRWGSLLSMIAHGSVEVKFGSQAGLPIRVAEEALERILVNLVHNAMTATRGGGAIRIGVGRAETRRPSHNEVRARPGNRMVLTVDDSGCGMTEEQIAKALGQDQLPHKQPSANLGQIGAAQTPGIAASSTSTKFSTAVAYDTHRKRGLGLQIVRELVSASGGELAIFSRRGAGTRIEIQWPVVEPAFGLERIPPASVGAAAASSRGSYAGGRIHNLAGAFNNGAPESAETGSTSVYDGNTQQRLNAALEGAVAC